MNTKRPLLNLKKCELASMDPYYAYRLEQCIINAKTDLAKIRLINAAIVIAYQEGRTGPWLP